jgi:hypothetical protein
MLIKKVLAFPVSPEPNAIYIKPGDTAGEAVIAISDSTGSELKVISGSGEPTAVLRPAALSPLLMYHGNPIQYNGLNDAEEVANAISENFSIWIVGDGYQDAGHADYTSTVEIITAVRSYGVRVYGTVPTGHSTSGLSLVQIEAMIDQWDNIGVDGIYLEDFGFDKQNTRVKQASIANYVHGKNLPYVADSGSFAYLTCDNIANFPYGSGDGRYTAFSTYNPTNMVLPRTASDAFLFKDFGFSEAGAVAYVDAQQQMLEAQEATAAANIGMWGLALVAENPPGTLDTTALGSFTDATGAGAYLSALAYLYGVQIVGSMGAGYASGSQPITLPLFSLSTSARYPIELCQIDGTAKTAIRDFGQVRISVTNTAVLQQINISDSTGGYLVGTYPAVEESYATLDGTEELSNKTFIGTREKHIALGAGTNIDLSTGNYFSKTITGATTLTVSNVPGSNIVPYFVLQLTDAGSADIDFWAGVEWEGKTLPEFTVSGKDSVGFYTLDGGTTWVGVVIATDIGPAV